MPKSNLKLTMSISLQVKPNSPLLNSENENSSIKSIKEDITGEKNTIARRLSNETTNQVKLKKLSLSNSLVSSPLETSPNTSQVQTSPTKTLIQVNVNPKSALLSNFEMFGKKRFQRDSGKHLDMSSEKKEITSCNSKEAPTRNKYDDVILSLTLFKIF